MTSCDVDRLAALLAPCAPSRGIAIICAGMRTRQPEGRRPTTEETEGHGGRERIEPQRTQRAERERRRERTRRNGGAGGLRRRRKEGAMEEERWERMWMES